MCLDRSGSDLDLCGGCLDGCDRCLDGCDRCLTYGFLSYDRRLFKRFGGCWIA